MDVMVNYVLLSEMLISTSPSVLSFDSESNVIGLSIATNLDVKGFSWTQSHRCPAFSNSWTSWPLWQDFAHSLQRCIALQVKQKNLPVAPMHFESLWTQSHWCPAFGISWTSWPLWQAFAHSLQRCIALQALQKNLPVAPMHFDSLKKVV